jgi:uncharacterized lipoprotein YbaY
LNKDILMLRLFPLLLLTLIGILGLSGCKNSSSKKNPTTFDKPATLPAAFEDSFGETWTCINAEEANTISGTVRFTQPVAIWNADILHISLLEIRDNNVSLVATHCLNNIGSQPIAYQLTYPGELIDASARYVLSTVFFTQLDGTYVASYRPDGFLEVINNQVLTNANILLKVPG